VNGQSYNENALIVLEYWQTWLWYWLWWCWIFCIWKNGLNIGWCRNCGVANRWVVLGALHWDI